MSHEGIALLLTGTVRAKKDLPDPSRVLSDPDERQSRYLKNLRYWTGPDGWPGPIVFAENSGFDLGIFKKQIEEPNRTARVEWVDAGPNDFPGSFGKGFGEALLMKRAFMKSSTLRRVNLTVKVTGLQTVANLRDLIRRVPNDVRWMADLRDHQIFKRLGIPASGTWCDTRLFVVQPAFFLRYLADVHENHGSGHFYLESAYYQVMRQRLADSGVYPRFPIEPQYRGRAGHWGKDYDGLRERSKRLIRSIVRRLFPGLWI